MTVRECYSLMGGDYEGVLGNLMKDERIQKYLLKFVNCDDMDNLVKSVEEKNYPDAFRFSHNLKGMSLNLGFTALSKSSDIFCESVRHGAPTVDISPLLADVARDYEIVIEAIKKL